MPIKSYGGTHRRRLQQLIQTLLIGRKSHAILLRVPQMEDCRGKPCVLVLHAGVEKPNDQIRIFQPPSLVGLVKSRG